MKKRQVISVIVAMVFAISFAYGCTGMKARCTDCGKTVKITVLEGANFDFDKFNIRPDDKEKLDKDIQLLKQDNTLDISIEGHCDIVGSDAYNQKLSERRAKSVLDYFTAQGISKDRMRTVGYGRKKPMVPNDSKENRAKNRRVEIHIIKARP